MKLNYECVRDLLIYLEENLSYTKQINILQLELKDYSTEVLTYTAEKLIEADYIDCIVSKGFQIPTIIVKSITFDGHQFLDNVRDDKIWNKTKSALNSFKSISIDIISETASKVLIHLIDQKLSNL